MSIKKTVEPVVKKRKSTYKRKKPRAVGRPPKFHSAVIMMRWIEAYFKKCDENEIKKYTKKGKEYKYPDPIPYTLEGLAGALGVNRCTLAELEKNEKFSGVLSWARERVSQNRIEGGLRGKQNPLLVKFLLSKNDKEHYDDAQKVELSGNVGIRGLFEELNGSANKLPGAAEPQE